MYTKKEYMKKAKENQNYIIRIFKNKIEEALKNCPRLDYTLEEPLLWFWFNNCNDFNNNLKIAEDAKYWIEKWGWKVQMKDGEGYNEGQKLFSVY
jgi:hypothetical protein